MILRRRLLELVERRLVLLLVVEQVCEVDARFRIIGVQLQRATKCGDRGVILSGTMLRIAHAAHRFGRAGLLLHRNVEELCCILDQVVSEKCASHLQHQLHVILITQLQDAAEILARMLHLPEPQQGFSHSGEPIFVFGIQRERFLEAPARPGILLTGKTRISLADVQLNRDWVQHQPFTQHRQRVVEAALVVELMGAFVVLFGRQKLRSHRGSPPGKASAAKIGSTTRREPVRDQVGTPDRTDRSCMALENTRSIHGPAPCCILLNDLTPRLVPDRCQRMQARTRPLPRTRPRCQQRVRRSIPAARGSREVIARRLPPARRRAGMV